MGGVAAIRAAAREPGFSAVIAQGGYHNLGEDFVEGDATESPPLLERLFLYTVAGVFWLQTGVNPWDISPIDDLASISPRPLLMIYGEHEVAHNRAQRQYEAAQAPKTLWVVTDGHHGDYHLVAPQEYPRRLLTFFDQALLDQ